MGIYIILYRYNYKNDKNHIDIIHMKFYDGSIIKQITTERKKG